MASAIPIHKLKSAGSWFGRSKFENVEFKDFPSDEVAGCSSKSQHAIGLNSYSSDYVQMADFVSTTFNNVHDDAVAYIYDSKAGWAVIDDCGEFSCTGPNNIVMKFGAVTCSGTEQPAFCADNSAGFTITSKMRDSRTTISSNSFAGCVLNSKWNSFLCTGENSKKIGIMVFESLDSDTWDRSVQPIVVTGNEQGSTYKNMLNSAMDHVWDGFYTGQTRLSRFPMQIENDMGYTVSFTGTPPGKMRFLLKSGIEGTGIFMRIRYAEAGAYQVLVNNEVQEFTEWNTEIGMYAPLKKTKCGENRYVGIKNFMEFYITPGCEI